MEEAAVHLVQRLLSLRETRVPGRSKHRVEEFQRRVSVVRRSAASDLVHESPQNLVSSFPLHQVFGVQFSVYDVTWYFTPRNPLFLRPEAPRPQVRMGRCRHGRGASLPAIPCFFVWKHHVHRSGWADAGMDVVLHSPQSLIPSSRGTTSPAPDGIGKGSADEFAIRLHFLPLLFCIDRKSSGAIAPLLFLHNPIKFYYFTFPLLFGAEDFLNLMVPSGNASLCRLRQIFYLKLHQVYHFSYNITTSSSVSARRTGPGR